MSDRGAAETNFERWTKNFELWNRQHNKRRGWRIEDDPQPPPYRHMLYWGHEDESWLVRASERLGGKSQHVVSVQFTFRPPGVCRARSPAEIPPARRYHGSKELEVA